jgi:outer membrane protein OmpA-like peptidoglycan-associated protein
MRKMVLAAGAVAMFAGTPALAQQAAGSDVSSYLCTFAGKCGDTPAAEDEGEPTMAAPRTKGFRVAAAGAASAPTMAAPNTRGFRVAGSTPTVAAPNTRGFRVAGAPTASMPAPDRRGFRVNTGAAASAPVAATPRQARVVRAQPQQRRLAAATRPAQSVGAARADLMLTFEYNSAQMTPAGEARARSFAQALMTDELRAKRFMIEGHTDSRGSADANLDLSRRRAQAVADYLVAQGVDRSRVEVKGVGSAEPLPGRAASSESNRRVEAVLLS